MHFYCSGLTSETHISLSTHYKPLRPFVIQGLVLAIIIKQSCYLFLCLASNWILTWLVVKAAESWNGNAANSNTPESPRTNRAVDGASLQCKPFTKEGNRNHFLQSLFFCGSHPSLTKPWCYCYTPRAQFLSGLIKRSRQILATVNKSAGQKSLFTPACKFICYALWSSFRSL